MRRLAAVGSVFAVAALPGATQASTLSQSGSVLSYSAAPGERNALSISELGSRQVRFAEQSTALRIAEQVPGCAPDPVHGVNCDLAAVDRIEIRLGDGNDSFSGAPGIVMLLEGGSGDDVYSPPPGQAGTSQVEFRGGTGTDRARYDRVGADTLVTLDDAPGDGRIAGGRAIDRDNIRTDVEILQGGGNADTFVGSPGDDTFVAFGGNDTFHGRDGSDTFDAGAFPNGPTRMIGGPGRDTVSYARRDRGVTVTPDFEASPDGRDEGDQVAEVEVVEGGIGDDSLIVAFETLAGYRLIGGEGRDTLVSSSGSDRLIGGADEDVLRSGRGNDFVEARNLDRDEIDCGTGGDDVFLDRIGVDLDTNCEARFFAQPPIGRLRLDASVHGRTATIRVRWEHPVSWRHLRRIAVRIPRVGRTVLRPRAGRGRVFAGVARLRVPQGVRGRLPVTVVAVDRRGRRQRERAAAFVRLR